MDYDRMEAGDQVAIRGLNSYINRFSPHYTFLMHPNHFC